jgi:CRP-like cAMP-binding protein
MTTRSDLAETWRLDSVSAGPIIRAAHLGERRRYRKGTFLYHQGEVDTRFHFLLRGRVRISCCREDGAEFVLEYMGQWALCGEAAAFDGQPRFSSAVAEEDVEAIEFDAQRIVASFAEFPDLAAALLRVASMKQRVLAVRAQYLASTRPEARVAELLHRLSELYGVSDPEGVRIGISLTHEQIAAMTGTSRVTVTRVLKQKREDGDLQMRGRHIVVTAPDRLLP